MQEMQKAQILKNKGLYLIAVMFIFITLGGCGNSEQERLELPEMVDIPEHIVVRDPSEVDSAFAGYNVLTVSMRDAYQRMYGSGIPLDSLYTRYDILYGGNILFHTVALFEAQNPGWRVEVHWEMGEHWDDEAMYFFIPMDITEYSYFRELPERLQSQGSDGADVISMIGADKFTLIQNGLLADLRPFIQADSSFSMDDLLPNIVPGAMDAPLFAMPVSISFPVVANRGLFGPLIVGSYTMTGLEDAVNDGIWHFDDMRNFFQQSLDRSLIDIIDNVAVDADLLFAMTPQMLTRFLVDAHHSYFFNSTSGFNFNHPVFEEILDTVDWLYSQGLLKEIEHVYQRRIRFQYYLGLADRLEITPSAAALVPAMGTVMDFARFDVMPGVGYPMPRLRNSEGMPVMHTESFAINANSANQDAAWAFIRTMLSDEVQNSIFESPYLDRETIQDFNRGLPWTLLHNQSVLANLNGESIARSRMSIRMPDYLSALAWNTDRRAFFSQVNRVFGRYDAPCVMHIILEHAENFYAGHETMSDTIRNLNEAVNEYLRD